METVPDVMIIADHAYPKAPYFLRVARADGGIDQFELDHHGSAPLSLIAALKASVAKGHYPTHWYVVGSRSPWPMPSGILTFSKV